MSAIFTNVIDKHWKSVDPTAKVILPNERMSWPKTIGMGIQHTVAMFGGTVLVPLLTGFNPSTALFFSGISTLLFLIITGTHIPSYLGNSFSFVAPALAAKSKAEAQCGFAATGFLFMVIGLCVEKYGTAWIDKMLTPIVTGTVIMIIGVNLSPVAWKEFQHDPLIGTFTALVVIVLSIRDKGILSRLSIVVAVVSGCVVAAILGKLDFSPVATADWVGIPELRSPEFSLRSITKS
eukprot:PhF_6_TR21706/c0_g1_i2/m.31004